ncbi:MAG: PhzF family phenazine biosynthesis protein [Cyanobacteria bacterium P01_H01_bin.15]
MLPKCPLFQIDAFSDRPFGGNPAAVCILQEEIPDTILQAIAAEMNLSETAYIWPKSEHFELRWFTPTTEVPLCGHATLASAWALWSEGYHPLEKPLIFQTKSGELRATLNKSWIELNFPANFSSPVDCPEDLAIALGKPPVSVSTNSWGYLVEVSDPEFVRQYQPNRQQLLALPQPSLCITALAEPDSDYQILSRFFAPQFGIDEDPVTGAAHCFLGPYWRERLGQDTFLAYQASPRGGQVRVTFSGGDRVTLGGQAVTVFRAQLG